MKRSEGRIVHEQAAEEVNDDPRNDTNERARNHTNKRPGFLVLLFVFLSVISWIGSILDRYSWSFRASWGIPSDPCDGDCYETQ